MKIAVMGAGGIGGYVGGRLAESGEEVHLIARGAHLAALRENGLRVETPDGEFAVRNISATDDPAEIGPVDIVLFTVKLADTESAAALLAPLLGPQTRVVSLQNGIDSAGLIARHIDAGAVAPGTIVMAAYIKEPGVITFPGGRQLIAFDGQKGNGVLSAFATACNRTNGITAETSDDAPRMVWRKFVALSAFSAVTAITRLPAGILRENPEALALFKQLLAESIDVARANGHDFDADVFDAVVNIIMTQPPNMKSSLLVDLEAGKPTEVAWLSGRIHRLGQESGVPTPAHSVVWSALSPVQDGPVDMP